MQPRVRSRHCTRAARRGLRARTARGHFIQTSGSPSSHCCGANPRHERTRRTLAGSVPHPSRELFRPCLEPRLVLPPRPPRGTNATARSRSSPRAPSCHSRSTSLHSRPLRRAPASSLLPRRASPLPPLPRPHDRAHRASMDPVHRPEERSRRRTSTSGAPSTTSLYRTTVDGPHGRSSRRWATASSCSAISDPGARLVTHAATSDARR